MEAYRPQGTCSRQILYSVSPEGILTDVKFLGGCTGGMLALKRFIVGKPITEVITMCDGIKCKNGTSCPEQLAYALKLYIRKKQQEQLKAEMMRQQRENQISVTVSIDV